VRRLMIKLYLSICFQGLTIILIILKLICMKDDIQGKKY